MCDDILSKVEKARLSRWHFSVLGAAAVFYFISCAPGLLWQDSGVIQYRVWHNDFEGGMGLALSHPLFYVFAVGAKYIPVGEFAHRVNLVSAMAAAIAVANVFLLVRLWLGKNFPAVIAAVTLAVSHTFWRHGSIAETYTLYAALLTAELIILLLYCQKSDVKYLYWLGFANGLAISDHMLGSIPLACYAVFFVVLSVKKSIRIRDLAIIVVFWAVGALPYEYLIIKNIIQSSDMWGTLASAAFGDSWQGDVLNASLSMKIVKENILFLGLNFPTPNILLFFVGCIGLFKISTSRAFRNIIVALAILFLLFAFRYTVPDRYAFFIPFYCVVSIVVGLGVYFLQTKVSNKAFVYLVVIFSLLPIGVYAAVPRAAEAMEIGIGLKRQVPYRDEYKYFLQPWRTGYRGADRFAFEALDSVDKDAIIYADGTTAYPILLAQQVGGEQKDVTIVSGHGSINNIDNYDEEKIDRLFGERAIYVVSAVERYCPSFLSERYDLVKSGVLYRAVEKEDVN